jgi:hypothetical protein
MTTKGVEVWDQGYLAAGWRRADGSWQPTPTVVPDAFWSRLKARITKAGRMAEFKADDETLRATLTGHDVEIAMFRWWVVKLGVQLPEGHYPGEKLWPWSRGWTEDVVDSYLDEVRP